MIVLSQHLTEILNSLHSRIILCSTSRHTWATLCLSRAHVLCSDRHAPRSLCRGPPCFSHCTRVRRFRYSSLFRSRGRLVNRSESMFSFRPREPANERGTTGVAARGIAQRVSDGRRKKTYCQFAREVTTCCSPE